MADIQFDLLGFEGYGQTELAEIRRNIRALLATPEGTCLGDRSYGISLEALDKPTEDARALLIMDVANKLEAYEPRVELVDSRLQYMQDGFTIWLTIAEADVDGVARYDG